jgi:hypothetical protein
VAEAFELADESAAVASGVLGVAAVEELVAELVVGGALVDVGSNACHRARISVRRESLGHPELLPRARDSDSTA